MKLRLSLSNKAGYESILFEATLMQAAALAESVYAGNATREDTSWCLGTPDVVPYYRHADSEGSFADAMDLSARWFTG